MAADHAKEGHMTWQIRVPFRSRQDSLVDVAALVRHVPGQDEDRSALRQLVIQAQIDGVAASAGELIDHIDALEPTERRAMLDAARAGVGLESTEMVDARERLRSGVTARGELRLDRDGMWREATPEPRWGIGPSGRPVDLNVAEAEAARQRASDQSLRHQREAQTAEREAEADVLREHERARRAQVERELPGQMRGIR